MEQTEIKNVELIQQEKINSTNNLCNEINNREELINPEKIQMIGNEQMCMNLAHKLKKPDTKYTIKMRDGFELFGTASFLYACFYAFCMYQNDSGITYPFFVAGSLIYISFCLLKLEIPLKKSSYFYMISMMLLAVSTFNTDDPKLIDFNQIGIFLLAISLLLSLMYNTENWNLGKYISSIAALCITSVGEIPNPFLDAVKYAKTKLNQKNKKVFYIVGGIVVSIPLFLIIFALLISADVVFREMTRNIVESIDFDDVIPICFMIGFSFFVSYCILSNLCKKNIIEEIKNHRTGEPILAITVTSILTFLYIVFSVIQVLYLFLGKMELPAEYTYAQYAREGFFQLLAVSIINLIIVLVALSYFKQSKVLKGILITMSLCTYIMIISSFLRMIIYIQYYYLTFLRIFVLWALIVLFLLFTEIILYTVKERLPFFRYSMVTITVCYLFLSFLHPDYWIAKVNVENMENEIRSEFFKGEPYQDYGYLSSLSADAAPILFSLEEENSYYQSVNYNHQFVDTVVREGESLTWRRFNTSRYIAYRLLQEKN